MKVVLAAEARADLRDIAGFIGRDDPESATRFAGTLRSHCLSLGDRALLYPLAVGLEDLEVRRRLYRDYLIFYRVDPNQVTILHVLHGSRDYRQVFAGA